MKWQKANTLGNITWCEFEDKTHKPKFWWRSNNRKVMVKKVNRLMLVMEKQENLITEVEQQENGSVGVCESDERVSEKLAVVEYHLFFPQFSSPFTSTTWAFYTKGEDLPFSGSVRENILCNESSGNIAQWRWYVMFYFLRNFSPLSRQWKLNQQSLPCFWIEKQLYQLQALEDLVTWNRFKSQENGWKITLGISRFFVSFEVTIQVLR